MLKPDDIDLPIDLCGAPVTDMSGCMNHNIYSFESHWQASLVRKVSDGVFNIQPLEQCAIRVLSR
jgi:hypothetical protein